MDLLIKKEISDDDDNPEKDEKNCCLCEEALLIQDKILKHLKNKHASGRSCLNRRCIMTIRLS